MISEHKKRVEDLHNQMLVAEQSRLDLNSKIERGQSELAKQERGLASDKLAQEQELAEMTAAYRRLERVVVGHLQGVRKAVQADENAVPLHPNTA